MQQIVHNDVTEIHKTVSELFSNLIRKGKPTKFKLLIESRLNSLFIVANRETTDDIIELIEQVDVPVEGAKTTIHELQHSDATKLIPLITTVFPKTASIKIVPFAPFNALIIIANPTTSQQIIHLVDQLDIPRGNRQIKLHQLHYAAATTLAPLLSKIFADKVVAGKGEGKTATGSPVKIIAEPRLNALIIIADRLATDRVLQLISKLDTEQGTSGERQLKLIPLENTSAKRMANLLTKIFSDSVVAGKGEGKTAKASQVKIIEEELGKPVDCIFDYFDPYPFAAASLCQVHKARVRGEKRDVVVKVMRPHTAEIFANDLKSIRGLIYVLSRITSLSFLKLCLLYTSDAADE